MRDSEVIDCHVHLFGRGVGEAPIGTKEILTLMNTLRVDRSVVFASQSPNFPQVNDRIQEGLKEAEGRLVGFVRVNPWDGEAALNDLRKRVLKEGWKGMKLHPVLQGFPIVSEIAFPILEEASKLRIPILIHSGELFCTPAEIALASEIYPELTIIMGHMGGSGFLFEEALSAASRRHNIYLETSGAHAIRVQRAAERIGADRLVYGSDSPFEKAEWELKKLDSIDLPDDDVLKIKGENARGLLKKVPSYTT